VRVVIDTNTIVSGLLWHGPPRRVLDAARVGQIDVFTSIVLLAELEDVVGRTKFSARLCAAAVLPTELVTGLAALAHLVEPYEIGPVIVEDPDDDAVLACALAAGADFIISGDGHLLTLKEYHRIRIISPSDFVAASNA
jgi:uncharacterized protein